MSDNLEQFANTEIEAYRLFTEKYRLQYPEPQPPERITWKDAGPMYFLKIITTVAVVLLAAMRTAEQFYNVASINNQGMFPYFEAFLAVLGLEGLLVVLAAGNASKRKEINQFWSNLGIILILSISLIAGFGQSIVAIPEIPEMLYNSFSIALSIALASASIVAYIGGEIIGQELARMEIDYQKAIKLYREGTESYNGSLIAAWNRSEERKIARSDVKQMARNVSGNFRKVSATPPTEWAIAPQNTADWRKLKPEEKDALADMSIEEMVSLYPITERTARNWKVNLKSEGYYERMDG